jgi:hypothetical protein
VSDSFSRVAPVGKNGKIREKMGNIREKMGRKMVRNRKKKKILVENASEIEKKENFCGKCFLFALKTQENFFPIFPIIPKLHLKKESDTP